MFDIYHFNKTYGDTVVLEDCSCLFNGKIVFVAGKRKSGKTTLLRCMAGLEKHDGKLTALPGSRICYYEEHLAAPENLSGRQYLEMILDRERYKRKDKKSKLAEVTGLIGLSEAALRVPVRVYSLQDKKRLQLGQALVEQGDILLFDGLLDVFDETDLKEICALLEKLKSDSTVVITTNDKELAGLLQASQVVLSDGKLMKGGEGTL